MQATHARRLDRTLDKYMIIHCVLVILHLPDVVVPLLNGQTQKLLILALKGHGEDGLTLICASA